jgi:hypothetical protein
MIVVRVALSSLPRAVFFMAMALFTLSVVGSFVALGTFFWYDTDFWYVFEAGAVLKIAAALLSGFAISSGLLLVHYRRQESYMTFEVLLFLVCFFFSLLNLLWIAPVLFFL